LNAREEARPFAALIVEDDAAAAALLLAGVLSTLGVTALAASDGPSAVRLLARFAADIDCAFVAHRMLEGDGLAVGRALLGASPGLPLCLVGGGELLNEPRPDGFRCVLVRPFRSAQVEACLAAMGWERPGAGGDPPR
jgi:CheY-like chemotaxis protein